MVFGGRKFKDWKKQNPEGLVNIYLQSNGDANVMENSLNEVTMGKCRKQIREFMLKAADLGYFSKGTKDIEKEKTRRRNQHYYHWQQQQGFR
jgi:hypothetical protein